MTNDNIAHVDVFVTTDSGTRAYEWDIDDKDMIVLRYKVLDHIENWAAERSPINSNWLKLITGPEAGTRFHKPNSISKRIHSLMEK